MNIGRGDHMRPTPSVVTVSVAWPLATEMVPSTVLVVMSVNLTEPDGEIGRFCLMCSIIDSYRPP